jgi:hypothetical protein
MGSHYSYIYYHISSIIAILYIYIYYMGSGEQSRISYIYVYNQMVNIVDIVI